MSGRLKNQVWKRMVYTIRYLEEEAIGYMSLQDVTFDCHEILFDLKTS